MKNIILTLVAVVIVVGAWLFIRKPRTSTLPTSTSTTTVSDIDGSSDVGDNTDTGSDNASTTNDMILVSTPKSNTSISSPVTVSGQARGNWFFEASAPVKVTDKSGTVLGESHIEATGDWMTTEFVSFTGSVNYTLPNGATSTDGFVVFMNDNPSGDPARDLILRIPVKLF